MSSKRDNSHQLEQIIQRLNPHVPAGLRDDAMPRISRDSNAIRQLRTYVAAHPQAKGLLTGHIGVGKSTELAFLAKEMQSARFVIQCSVASTLGVHNVDTFTLLIVVLEAAIRSWIDRLGPMPPGLVEELVNHVRKLLPEGKRPPPAQPARGQMFEAFAAAQVSLQLVIGQLLGGRISEGEQLAKVYSECLQRLALRYVPDADLGSIDPSSVAQSCEVLLKELSSKAGLPVLIVIDDLDKVHDENVQASVYIDRAMAWMRLPCSVVATLPFETYFGTRASEVDDLWGAVHVLDPMPVPQEDGGDLKEPALQPYLTMVREAGANKVISAVQCRRLANLSGGLPRAFVHYCSSCVRYALEAGDAHVRDHQVDLVLRDMTAKWRGRLTDEDCQAIVRVLDSGGSNLRAAGKLLRDGVLIRHGDEDPENQVQPAAWARPLIDAYRNRHPEKAGAS